jgi:ATP-dependent RNA helicase DeaD
VSNSNRFSSVDIDAFRAKVDGILENIIAEDPVELNEYRDAFKKSVGLFQRSLVAGYLFKQLLKGEGHSTAPRRPKGKTTTLFISIGKNRRVFPRDLIGFFASKGDIKKGQIGDIKILDSYSFLEIEESVADEAIAKLDGENFRGRRLTVNHAKKKSDTEAS